MTYQELMMQSLSDLLENEEDLKFPIYGTLQQKNRRWFGFWGLTDNYLLSVLLVGSSKKNRLDKSHSVRYKVGSGKKDTDSVPIQNSY